MRCGCHQCLQSRAFNFAVPAVAPRQAVLLDMAFNMGAEGLLKFGNTLRAAREMRWKDARDGMLASKWAGQVGRRASELAEQMMTGEWPEE